MHTKKSFIAIGEALVDLSLEHSKLQQQAFVDCAKTCFYLTHYAQHLFVDVQILNFLGKSELAQWLLQTWQEKGINLVATNTEHDAAPTIRYHLQQDTITYQPRQQQCNSLNLQLSALVQAQYIYLSGLSTALLPENYFEQIYQQLIMAREAGCTIIIDTYYEPQLWPSLHHAQNWFYDLLRLTDIVLTSHQSDSLLFGETTPQQCLKRYHDLGINEVAIRYPGGSYISTKYSEHHVQKYSQHQHDCHKDAYNAAYIAARIKGLSPPIAARCGHNLINKLDSARTSLLEKHQMPILF